jgi:exopolyphosphatase/guanosine-5'-triphosphate,3'-diphosphate pyrophosphatase
MKSPVVAIIDVGSNTIKLLVAKKGSPLNVIEDKTCRTRIIQGAYHIDKRLTEESIEAVCKNINRLVQRAKKYSPHHISIVGTSAIRDADNQKDFIERVLKLTGCHLQVLSGEEEALSISQAVLQDPVLANVGSFYLLDLGGGSLELIDYINGSINQLVSMPTGAIRMADKFLENKSSKLIEAVAVKVNHFIHEEIKRSGFTLKNKKQPLVVTSGSLAVAKKLILKQNPEFNNESWQIPVIMLRSLYTDIAALTLTQRLKLPGMPASHADILPIALLIILFIADEIDADLIYYTKFNLRYGLATQCLAKIIEDS